MRRFEDKDDRIRRRLMLTLTDAALTTEQLLAELAALDLLPSIEGWNKDSAGAHRQLTLAGTAPRAGGEDQLIAALDAEPGIRMQLDRRPDARRPTPAGDARPTPPAGTRARAPLRRRRSTRCP